VLLLSNDLITPFAKTTEYFAAAMERRGIPAYVRDGAEVRCLNYLFAESMAPHLPDAQAASYAALRELVEFAGIDTVFSLDLHWYLGPGLFTEDAAIRQIHSYWFDDFRSWCTASLNRVFPPEGEVFQQNIRHPKVMHHFYGESMALEARLLGFTRQRSTRLAAPRHLLRSNEPCTRTDKLAFIGNPGFRGKPDAEAIKLMEEGGDIDDLRALSARLLIEQHEVKAVGWYKEEPAVYELLCAAVEIRRRYPYQPALQILQLCRQHVPRGFDYANEKGIILDLALLVKLVNRYDRPAFVHRLWKRGWIDVYSAPEEWEPYGIQALPYLQFRDLPRFYRMYAAHLNAPNSIRDATANEKLFEIAASGRVSINLDSPDVRSCFAPGEIGIVSSLAALEDVAERMIRDPDLALAAGERARRRCAAEHLWDHRVAAMFEGA
jgi:hypothetical protein